MLLVEDDRSLAAMLEEILRSAGYDVELAHDGQAGSAPRAEPVLRRDRAGPRPAGDRGTGPARRLASRGVRHPGPRALRARPDPGSGGRPRCRRRGLPDQAVRHRRAARPGSVPCCVVTATGRRPAGPGGRLLVSSRIVADRSGARPRSCPSASVRCWRCWPDGPDACSAGPSSWPRSSPTPTRTGSSTPTCTTCGASCPANVIRTVRGLGYQLGSGTVAVNPSRATVSPTCAGPRWRIGLQTAGLLMACLWWWCGRLRGRRPQPGRAHDQSARRRGRDRRRGQRRRP